MATKVGRYEQEIGDMFDFTREKTLASVEASLQRLGLDYIDLIQVENIWESTNINMVKEWFIYYHLSLIPDCRMLQSPIIDI